LFISLRFLTLQLKVLFMKNETEHLETLSEIRSLMERSSRFISLNGFAGVFAGIFALIGASAAYMYLHLHWFQPNYYEYSVTTTGYRNTSFYTFFLTDALLVLISSLTVAIVLSVRKARKKGMKLWDNTAKRLFLNMLIPLAGGGCFCLVLVYHGYISLVAPATLLFYGLALINASKYTFNEVRHLGLAEMFIGLAASIWIGYGLLFWAFGFGVMHIIYGIIMYYKYER
jgi:hypothetical protein